jgi:hypothetical protein
VYDEDVEAAEQYERGKEESGFAQYKIIRRTLIAPNRPRSGMVPPLVTAMRCAPGRPVTVPASRSHTTRGRSSANASDGYRPASRSSVAS